MFDLNAIPFVKAKHFGRANNRPIDLIVIHDMEAPETDTTAENVARMFATTTREVSAHYNIDNNSIVQSVLDGDIAYAAPGANHNGLHLEHAGYASQRLADWADVYSNACLILSAKLTNKLCRLYDIPMKAVGVEGLLRGESGITTHAAVSLAFKKSTHTDPGPNFPLYHYIDLVTVGVNMAVPEVTIPEQKGIRPVVNAPVVAILLHPSWEGGYIEIGSDGGTFSQGAPNYGSLGAMKLNAPIVGGAVHPTGKGYWLVGADGGVFPFGESQFRGSTGNIQLNKPITGIAPSKTGEGYLLCASDGGVFAFGDAEFKGSVEYRG